MCNKNRAEAKGQGTQGPHACWQLYNMRRRTSKTTTTTGEGRDRGGLRLPKLSLCRESHTGEGRDRGGLLQKAQPVKGARKFTGADDKCQTICYDPIQERAGMEWSCTRNPSPGARCRSHRLAPSSRSVSVGWTECAASSTTLQVCSAAEQSVRTRHRTLGGGDTKTWMKSVHYRHRPAMTVAPGTDLPRWHGRQP